MSTYTLSGRKPGSTTLSWWQPLVPEWGVESVRKQAEAAGYQVEASEDNYAVPALS